MKGSKAIKVGPSLEEAPKEYTHIVQGNLNRPNEPCINIVEVG